jgi:hypothetical protein
MNFYIFKYIIFVFIFIFSTPNIPIDIFKKKNRDKKSPFKILVTENAKNLCYVLQVRCQVLISNK